MGLEWSHQGIHTNVILQIICVFRFAMSGLDLSSTDYNGRTALHQASAEGHMELVEVLLKQYKVNPAPTDRYLLWIYSVSVIRATGRGVMHNTALHRASSEGHIGLVAILIHQYKVNPAPTDRYLLRRCVMNSILNGWGVIKNVTMHLFPLMPSLSVPSWSYIHILSFGVPGGALCQ